MIQQVSARLKKALFLEKNGCVLEIIKHFSREGQCFQQSTNVFERYLLKIKHLFFNS
jgi:hypothetical protein